MEAFHRLSQLRSTVTERASSVWKSAAVQLARCRQWLMPRRRMVFWVAGLTIALLLLIGFVMEGGASWYGKHHDALAPLLTLAAGVSVAAVAATAAEVAGDVDGGEVLGDLAQEDGAVGGHSPPTLRCRSSGARLRRWT
jgi:hypothetical protein